MKIAKESKDKILKHPRFISLFENYKTAIPGLVDVPVSAPEVPKSLEVSADTKDTLQQDVKKEEEKKD